MKKSLISLLLACLLLFSLISCGTEPEKTESGLDKAKDYVYQMYKDIAADTPSGFQRVSAVLIDGENYTVEWSADAPDYVTFENDGKLTAVNINAQTPEEINYVLKAKITGPDGAEAVLEFRHKIPAFTELSFDEFAAAAKSDPVVVKGTVTGVIAKSKGNKYNCLYLQGGDKGGYYVYNLNDDPAEQGILEGMTVRVSGTKDIYNGTLEIINASVEILDETVASVIPFDFTEAYKTAADLKAEALTYAQAALVTLRGVEITGIEESSGYYKFKLGDKESYVRISSSVCPLTSADQTAFKDAHKSHTGWIADVTGVICVYNNAFYLTPVTKDAFMYLSQAEKTEDEKIAYESENLLLENEFIRSAQITLPFAGTAYPEVGITWSSGSEYLKIDNDLLTVTVPNANTVATLTATLKLGEKVLAKVFTVKLTASTVNYTVAEAIAAMKDFKSGEIGKEQITVTGTAVSSTYDSKHNSFTVWLTDGVTEKAFQIYSAVLDASLDDAALQAADAFKGKTVTCTGFLQLYVSSGSTTYEMAYLNNSKSPTGKETSPVITSIK